MYYQLSKHLALKIDVRSAANDVHFVTGIAVADPQHGDTAYTCPMHAQVQQSAPGRCPICGMALEPAGE